MDTEVKKILKDVQNGDLSIDEAVLKLKMQPFEDIGFAKVDLHRGIRQGVPEVIYGAGKTTEQILSRRPPVFALLIRSLMMQTDGSGIREAFLKRTVSGRSSWQRAERAISR